MDEQFLDKFKEIKKQLTIDKIVNVDNKDVKKKKILSRYETIKKKALYGAR